MCIRDSVPDDTTLRKMDTNDQLRVLEKMVTNHYERPHNGVAAAAGAGKEVGGVAGIVGNRMAMHAFGQETATKGYEAPSHVGKVEP